MPDNPKTRTVRNLQLAAALCLLLVVVVWFVTSMDFASLVALVTALGAVVALFRRRSSSNIDIFIVVILVVVTAVGLYAIFTREKCLNMEERVINCEITDQFAAKLMYGEQASVDEAGLVTIGSEATVKIVLAKQYQEQGDQKYILFTQRYDPNTCAECLPELDGMVLTEVDDAWHVDVLQKGIAQFGTQESNPVVDIKEIGSGKFGFMFYYSGPNDGMRYQDAVLIDQIGGRFYIIFNELIGLDNSASCEGTENCWGYNSQLDFIQDNKSEFWDIQITSSGTIVMEDGAIIPISEQLLYRYSSGDNRYVEK